jgi:hypothetical protein
MQLDRRGTGVEPIDRLSADLEDLKMTTVAHDELHSTALLGENPGPGGGGGEFARGQSKVGGILENRAWAFAAAVVTPDGDDAR